MKATLYPYQTVLASQVLEEFNAGRTNVVLAAACGAGKTITSIAICEELLKKDPALRILVLTHGQVILRTQYVDDIIEQQPTFTHTLVKSCEDLDAEKQVYVGLPQTVSRCKKHKFDVIIIDEAHHFYFCPDGMVQSIIKNSKPRFTLFLTGSPSKFIKQQYTLYAISLLELYELGRVCSPVVELAQSTYDYTLADYNSEQELKSRMQFSPEKTKETLDSLLTQVVRTLKSVDRATPEARTAQVSPSWVEALRLLDKTMFVCRSQIQAKLVRAYLQAAGVDVALSTSDSDEKSEEIERFKNTEKYMVLVVVNRGTLGFNMPELVNIVDMSGSLNTDVLFQMFARLVRRHPTKTGKLFLKVVPEAMAEYVYVLMSFVIALSHKSIYETYGGEVKKAKIPVPADYVKSVQSTSAREGTRRPRLLTFAELPPLPRIEVMTSLSHKNGQLLSSYAYTTLEEVGNRLKIPFLPFEEARDYARSLGLRARIEWEKLNLPNAIPRNCHDAYKRQWQGWGDFLGTGNVQRKVFLSFEEARDYARSLGLRTATEWKKPKCPNNIPSNPQLTYKGQWQGWGDFLGTGNRLRKNFVSFTEARAYARSLGLRSYTEWRRAERPSTIPANPGKVYKEQWQGWGDFLGTGNIALTCMKFVSFTEARAYARSLGIKGGGEWRRLKRPSTLPSHPDDVYKDEWSGWGDFLGYKGRSCKRRIRVSQRSSEAEHGSSEHRRPHLKLE